jgi:hypothetical protein
MLAWESHEQRDDAFRAFTNDPEWLTVREESERDGPLLQRIETSILVPTDYSPGEGRA